MAVSYASNRVTVTPYKTGTTTSDSTTTLLITSGEIVAGDVGRFVAVQPDAGDSGKTQVREITAVSGGTISISDSWNGTIASSTKWVVSHNLADVHALNDANLQKIGDKSYRWAADWSITTGGFLGDKDISLEMNRDISVGWIMEADTIVQFGLLRGSEGTGTETTGGCRLRFHDMTAAASAYSNNNARVADGPVVNYYGCLVHSTVTAGQYLFQRMLGPTRFIGCNFDGPMGGRFYHEASEWVRCKMTGNNATTPAWSIGVTFTRAIDNILSYRNLASMKSYMAFGGTLRNVTFSNNTYNFSCEANSNLSVFDFIDCTEFGSALVVGTGGVHNFYRSVVLKTTDSSGANLAGVTVRVNNKNDATQSTVKTSDASGDVAEILAQRFQKPHNTSDQTSYAPFRIRYRKYGYVWQSLNAAIADPIKQATALLANSNVTQDSATALAHTGITVTDHGASPEEWEGKDWGITVTGNLTTNSSLTADDIEHYLHYHLAQDSSFNDKASGLLWHDLAPVGTKITQRDTYGSVTKGVRVVDENGDAFPGFAKMQSDDGTYWTAPSTLTITGLQTGSKVAILETGTETLLQSSAESSGSVFYGYAGADVGGGIDIAVLSAGYLYQKITNYILTSSDATLPVTQAVDYGYDAAKSADVTFNGTTKRIICDVGTTALDVVGVYTEWVDWALTSDNLQYNNAFNELGGNTIDAVAGTSVPVYGFLTNDWKIAPDEKDHTLSVANGIILVDGGGDPFVDTTGAYTVRINYQQPVQVIVATVSTSGAVAPTASEMRSAIGLNSANLDDQISALPDSSEVGLTTDEHDKLMELENPSMVVDGVII